MKKSEHIKLPRLIFEKCLNESKATSTSIVTVFNQQYVIRSVIESLVSSTSLQTDLIIIDDGSEDLSLAEIIRALNEIKWDRHSFSVIKVYVNSHSRFEVFCDNFGVTVAQTKYAILIQADVLITEFGFDRIFLSALKSSPDLLMVSGRGTQMILPIAKEFRRTNGIEFFSSRVHKLVFSRKHSVNCGHYGRLIISALTAIFTKIENYLYLFFKDHESPDTSSNNGGNETRPDHSNFSCTGVAGYIGRHTQTENSNFKDVGTIWESQTVMRGPLCIDRNKFEECGGLNTESYFLVYDDHDLSLRAYLKRKYRVGYVPIGYYSNLNWGAMRKKRSLRQTQLLIYESLRMSNSRKTTDLYKLDDSSSSTLPIPQIRNFDLFS